MAPSRANAAAMAYAMLHLFHTPNTMAVLPLSKFDMARHSTGKAAPNGWSSRFDQRLRRIVWKIRLKWIAARVSARGSARMKHPEQRVHKIINVRPQRAQNAGDRRRNLGTFGDLRTRRNSWLVGRAESIFDRALVASLA